MVFKVGDSVNFVDRLCKNSAYEISKVGKTYAYFGSKDHLRVFKGDDASSATVQSKYLCWARVGRLVPIKSLSGTGVVDAAEKSGNIGPKDD